MTADSKKETRFEPPPKPIVVGVGASAGGLDALGRFVSRLSQNSRMAFVIIQHLDPTHDSALTALLSRKTRLAVREVTEDMKVESDHIYVIPPNHYLSIHDGKLQVEKPDKPRGTRMAIDHFFRSLAADAAERSIGIVLSGTGSDGTAGLKEIKEVGGLVIAQEPDEAQHSGMPASAIQSGLIDLVLPVDKMAERLTQYAERSFIHASLSDQALDDEEHRYLMPIFQILRQKAELDFRSYRKKTVLRRIQRRMGLAHIDSLEDYVKRLRESDSEVQSLGRDILINVTGFFRDQAAWERIESNVLGELVERAGPEKPLRIWVAGCATGEEAYSFAMLIAEKTAGLKKPPTVQIFATDIAENALATAREGRYPKSLLGNVSEERLKRFFIEDGDGVRVNEEIRSMVTFAPHNLLTQPPFSNLDLVSCRNLLIYFEPDVQKHVMDVFHFSLADGGFLFLGSSETVGRSNLRFSPISKQWRIYRSRGRKSKVPKHLETRLNAVQNGEFTPRFQARSANITELALRQFLDASGAALAVINADNRVSFLQGAVDNFFRVVPGELSAQLPDLLEICRDNLRTKVRSCLYRARQKRKRLVIEGRLDEEAGGRGVRISARPFEQFDHQEDVYLVAFEVVQSDKLSLVDIDKDQSANAAAIIKDLEHELSSTREQLNCSIEEFETANEELKASHEEAMSMNEELQSSNEELETSKEELQSLNEELTTLNHQLENKIEELQDTTDDLNNLLASTNIATLFLDTKFRLRRFTPRAQAFFNLRQSDIGRPFSEISATVEDPKLIEDAKAVLETLRQIERKVRAPEGSTLMRRINPYRTSDNRIEGVAITLDDITSIEVVTQRLESRERQQAAVAAFGRQALSRVDVRHLMQVATQTVRDVLQADFAKVLELRPDKESMLLVAGAGWKDGYVGTHILRPLLNSQAGYSLLSNNPVIVEDLAKETRFNAPPILTDHHVKSGMSVIIGETDKPYGVIGVHSKRITRFSEDDVAFLQGIANILAEALYRQADQRTLQESELRFRTLADNIAQLAWTADASGSIYWYNKRWYDYTGTTFEEMKGWGWEKVHHPDLIEKVVAKFNRHIRDGEVWEDTFPLRSKEGEYRWFLSRAMPIRNGDGEVILWLGTNTDIEDRRMMEQALRRSDEQKDQFIATLAHELRNPLAPIKMGVGMLQREELPEAERSATYEILDRQTEQLVRLVDDLMDISRISRGKLTLQREPVTLQRIITSAIETVRPLVEESGHRVEVNLPEADVFLNADRTRLTQVFANLLSNAARYSEEPSRIGIEARVSGGSVEVAVIDEGVGISLDMLDHIFEIFTQVDGQNGSGKIGLGIGLTLVKTLVEMHEGRVSAKSEGRGKGSQFKVTLPVVEAPAEQAQQVSEASEEKPGSKRVLIVDDNKNAADMVSKFLEFRGHQVKVVYSGQGALDAGSAFEPELILMDIGMPEMDGYETAKRVRKCKWGKSAVLAATTGWGQDKDRERTMQAGFDHHLVKPVDVKQLLELIKSM